MEGWMETDSSSQMVNYEPSAPITNIRSERCACGIGGYLRQRQSGGYNVSVATADHHDHCQNENSNQDDDSMPTALLRFASTSCFPPFSSSNSKIQ
mmetsp:Transcript_14639/g.40400  ORF Transcript_14639/g.40400 Transcript_14639/m.40400 type:complete len:96 (-) Transcript_14639:1163-1450(-)